MKVEMCLHPLLSLLSYEIFNFSSGTPAWSCPIAWAFRRFDKRGIFTSYKRPLSKLQLYITQTLFKANFIFQTKGDHSCLWTSSMTTWTSFKHMSSFKEKNITPLTFMQDMHCHLGTIQNTLHLQKKWRLRCWKQCILQHFTSDFALYSGVLHIPWLHNHGRWHIIVKRNNQAFQWYQFLFS